MFPGTKAELVYSSCSGRSGSCATKQPILNIFGRSRCSAAHLTFPETMSTPQKGLVAKLVAPIPILVQGNKQTGSGLFA